ncbi:BON domain-containing protein [Dyadobacter frigoris]|uniref:BON domain-containing protein n=1 Tax=Dyadobacter frigoris TaxID=2576211 RepID=A0A4U6CPV7_9BACT|nr:BON domain-containing protein [Dyadobacter frigoris]TKT86512.1 BON domain-containing protein [Dyadobacter frigoris]
MSKITEVQKSWEPDYDSEAARLETDKTLEIKVWNALKANVFINSEKIRVRVTGRLVFLEGTVHLQKERISAQNCIRDIFGIRAVINYLTYHNEYAM